MPTYWRQRIYDDDDDNDDDGDEGDDDGDGDGAALFSDMIMQIPVVSAPNTVCAETLGVDNVRPYIGITDWGN